MSQIEQTHERDADILSSMQDTVRILAVEQDADDGIVVTFSDGTKAGYVVEELLQLRPYRKWCGDDSEASKPPKSGIA